MEEAQRQIAEAMFPEDGAIVLQQVRLESLRTWIESNRGGERPSPLSLSIYFVAHSIRGAVARLSIAMPPEYPFVSPEVQIHCAGMTSEEIEGVSTQMWTSAEDSLEDGEESIVTMCSLLRKLWH